MDEDNFEYSNGADGSCSECGDETEERWHVQCRRCYAADQGWQPPPAGAIAVQHEQRERVSLTRVLARVAELERRVTELENGGDPTG